MLAGSWLGTARFAAERRTETWTPSSRPQQSGPELCALLDPCSDSLVFVESCRRFETEHLRQQLGPRDVKHP